MPVGDLFLPFIALTALECHDNGLVNPYYQTLMTERYVSRKFSALGSSFLTRTAQIARKWLGDLGGLDSLGGKMHFVHYAVVHALREPLTQFYRL